MIINGINRHLCERLTTESISEIFQDSEDGWNLMLNGCCYLSNIISCPCCGESLYKPDESVSYFMTVGASNMVENKLKDWILEVIYPIINEKFITGLHTRLSYKFSSVVTDMLRSGYRLKSFNDVTKSYIDRYEIHDEQSNIIARADVIITNSTPSDNIGRLVIINGCDLQYVQNPIQKT